MLRQIVLLTLLLCFLKSVYAQVNYPATKTVDSADTWHNVIVKDPYRWLEDLKAPEVLNWFRTQSKFTDSVLNNLTYVDSLFSELVKLDISQPEQKYGVKRVGNSVYYNKIIKGESKFKVYRQDDNKATPTVIASADMWGDNYGIYSYDIDPSEKYIAICAQEAGKEINDVKIYSIVENKILPDKIEGNYKGFIKNKNATFYYVQLPTYEIHKNFSHGDEIFKSHIIGTDTSLDRVITSKQINPEIMSFADGSYLYEIETFKNCDYEFAWIGQTSTSELWYRKSSTIKWEKLFSADDMVYNIYHYNNKLYYTSLKNAPNGTIKLLDLNNVTLVSKTILPEQDNPLDYYAITQTKSYLIVPLKKNGISIYTKFVNLQTNKISPSPFKESTARTRYFGAIKNDSVLIVRESWANFPQISIGNIETNKETFSKYYTNQSLPFANNLTVEEIEVPSYDGTLVPLTIIRRKDLILNGNNVAIVNGYGAYGESISPYFDQTYAMLANKGVVVCFAHVRGGGEKGLNWHLSGMKQSKPNSWKDLNSCAEYLISKGYTSTTHLACEGGSAGGILIGRAVTERPDLWACAVPEVGVLNIVRGEHSAYGKTNNDEFGATENINEFFSMLESDAVLHIEKGIKYPAMLVVTGWNDPRVSSWQCGKFAAAAQNATTSGKPVLLKVNFNGGHGGDMTDKKTTMKQGAEKYAFILSQCEFEKANKYN